MMGKRLRPAMTSDKKIGSLIAIVLLVALYIFLFMLDNALPSNSTTVMLITVLKKGAIYALVCVSMNLLKDSPACSLWDQAGFMLIGAYAFSIFSIPAEQHASVYQYFDGGAIQFSIPEMLGNVFGANAGNFLGAIICIVIARIGGRCICRTDRHPRPAAEERLFGHCHTGLCRDYPGDFPVEWLGKDHQWLQPAAEIHQLP